MRYADFWTKLLIRTGIARFLPTVQRLTDGGGAYLHYYSDQVLTAPLTELRELAAYQGLQGPDTIDLTWGAPRFDLVSSGSTKLPADRRGWPSSWGLPELRDAVAEKLLADHSLDVNPADEVLVTHGAAGAFSLALDTFVNRGDRVVLFDPTSPLYILSLRHRRARIRWLSTWMDNGRTRFRLDALAQALSGARMLILTSPGNPTGGVIAAEDLEQIAWWAERKDVLIYSDGVFAPYQYDGVPASIGPLAKARRRTLTVGSVSKQYALASLRVGWLAGYRHLVRPCALMAVMRSPFVPTLCQQVAVTALRQSDEAFRTIRTTFESRRRYAFERLQALGLEPDWPAGAFSLWVPVRTLGIGGRRFAEQLLHTKKVLVSPGSLFGPSGSGHIRLSYATEDGRLREGLSRLTDFVGGLRVPMRHAA
ncbi:MAG TPA: pyridoxal phosphate-dependent aminotransferase [Gemmataceae bacterium]|nr:pyridoxal phosphate-dependent aminotransferase [Gemmataceae bacterium]